MDDRDSIRREVLQQLRDEDPHTWRDWALYAAALLVIAFDVVVWWHG